MGISDACGKRCHEDQLETYAGSIHGKESFEKKNVKAAVCSDCHGAHAVSNSSGDPFKLAVPQSCGSCHKENFNSYKATCHGQISTLGCACTAKCYDCHGILQADDPNSKVHCHDRMKSCQQCHNGKKDLSDAPAGFATFLPHGHAGDFKRYLEIWIAWQIMVQLLVGTFAFFRLHTLLWFYREYRDRKARSTQPHVRPEAVPPHLQGKRVKRFSPVWRAAHLVSH